MDEIRMLTISGDYASAKAKLTAVQSLTEILRPIPFSGPAERQQLLKQIVSLNAILRAQRLLLERTADEKAEKGLAEKQKALLKELKGLESDYYGFSDSAEAVSKAMSDAAAMISVGTYGDAAQKQKEAVDSLKSAARGLGEQLKAIMAAGSETQDMGGGVVGAAGILINDGYMETPDDMSLDRAKEIIDELQRKKDKNIKSKSEGGRTDELLRNF
jgi:hypothetical protein